MTSACRLPIKRELIDEHRSHWSRPDGITLLHGDVMAGSDDGVNGSLMTSFSDQPICLATSRATVDYGDVLDLSRGTVKVDGGDDDDDGVLNLSSSSSLRGDPTADSSSDDVTVDMADASSTSFQQVSSAGTKRSLKGIIIIIII